MINDFNDIEFAYTTKEIAEKTNQSKPVIRKYGQMLEAAGYEFIKDGNRRIFVEADVIAMFEMKKSDNIDRTARELAEKQKKLNAVKNDIKNSISSVSPNDTISLQEKAEISAQIAINNKRSDEIADVLLKMANEYAVAREIIRTVNDRSEMIVSELLELKKHDKEAKKEKEHFIEKLNIVINYIQSQENVKKGKKKGFWQRLFG